MRSGTIKLTIFSPCRAGLDSSNSPRDIRSTSPAMKGAGVNLSRPVLSRLPVTQNCDARAAQVAARLPRESLRRGCDRRSRNFRPSSSWGSSAWWSRTGGVAVIAAHVGAISASVVVSPIGRGTRGRWHTGRGRGRFWSMFSWFAFEGGGVARSRTAGLFVFVHPAQPSCPASQTARGFLQKVFQPRMARMGTGRICHRERRGWKILTANPR